jgi:hypothetical protein
MAGVISPNMPVFEVYDRKFGGRFYTNFNEGIGKVLRYGALDKEVINRLKWIEKVLAPVLNGTLKQMRAENKDGLALKTLIAHALEMGDECHKRYGATNSLFIRELIPFSLASGFDIHMTIDSYKFMNANNFTAFNLCMAAAKAMTSAAHGIKYSTIVTTIARNGTNTAIRVSSLGDEWFQAPAPIPSGLFFSGFRKSDANADLGDSAITETSGLGALSNAASPAVVNWIGGTVHSSIQVTHQMYKITTAEHKYFKIPYFDFRGAPTGIDMRKVLTTGIAPVINTGIAHKAAGIGQIGAGTVRVPILAFQKAQKAFEKKYGAV